MLQVTNRTREMLEWPEFLHFFSRFVSSPAAQSFVTKIVPVENLQAELDVSREVLACGQKDSLPSLGAVEDISELLKKTAIQNQIMEGIELIHIARLAAQNNRVRNETRGWKIEYPLIFERTSKLPDLQVVEAQITAMIEPTGEIKEDATPELARLTKQISGLKSRVERTLEKYFKDSRYQTALQEDYATYRHGRAVLLVRTDNKSAIRGVIHGESGSGASVFLEPFPVLELNNELAQVNDRFADECKRILRELTALAAKHAEILDWSLRQLVDLDLLFARGRFGKAFNCSVPELTSEFRIDMRNARHPLLQDTLSRQNRAVIPFSYSLNADQKALVVTGPNTGGKTVFLKTTGLLLLMAHCGIPIPADEGTVLPELSSIQADIGDQQSIAESLSTFSSHIRNIVGILSNLKERSLILLDELGTGTDPEEGAPLAVAILQHLLRFNVKTLITSHHSALKMFAYQNAACVSAAMEFDSSRLQPTYRILLDQVGASHGIDIAEQLGLPSDILQSARAHTGETQREVREFLAKLQDRITTLSAEQDRLQLEKAEWQAKAEDQQKQLDRSQRKLEERLKTLRDQNTDLIRTINAKVEGLIETAKKTDSRQQVRKEYQAEVAPILSQLDNLTKEADAASGSQDFSIGDRVWVNLYKDYGEITGIKKDQAELVLRNKRFTVPLSTLEKRESIAESLPHGISVKLEEKTVEPEINVIGQTVEDALAAVDKYLDDAFVAQLPQVRIIHGFGMGKLRRAIEAALTGHPQVQGFHPEAQERGGGGVTVVLLKSR
ncbi:MAG TPA: endonuclease MutS2 [Acidobacteriota bacterium]|nr:endonuclease MutS2 [Acidobacteriota bacterium]